MKHKVFNKDFNKNVDVVQLNKALEDIGNDLQLNTSKYGNLVHYNLFKGLNLNTSEDMSDNILVSNRVSKELLKTNDNSNIFGTLVPGGGKGSNRTSKDIAVFVQLEFSINAGIQEEDEEGSLTSSKHL